MPAALTGLCLFALVVWQLTLPRTFYTGTNSVGVRSVVANVNPGQTLCIPDLSLPAETGRVQLAVFAHRPSFTGTIRVITAGGTSTSTMTGSPGPGFLDYASAPIPRRPSSPATVPATLCLSPKDGLFELGGMIGLQGNQVPARLGREAITNRIGVWFLPPAGTERSLLSQAPAIFRRAALFRPGIVGPWTYPVLLLLVLPPHVGARSAAAGARGERKRAEGGPPLGSPGPSGRTDHFRQRGLLGADHAGVQRP